MALESFTRRSVAIKAEVTEGTDTTPTAAANSILVLDGSCNVEHDQVERNVDRPTFGAKPVVLTNRRGMIRGTIELIGSATAGNAAPIAPLLKPCGHAEVLAAAVDAQYNPISSAIPSACARFWHAGDLYALTGARGRLDTITLAIDDFPKATFELMGKAAALAEAALPSDEDVSSFQAPPVIIDSNSVMTLNGFNVDGRSVELRPNVQNSMIHHTEGRVARHLDRRAELTLRFFKSAIASFNPDALLTAGTIIPVIFEITTSAGKNIRFDAPTAQIISWQPVEIEGMYAYEVVCRALPDAGDDEYLFTFS